MKTLFSRERPWTYYAVVLLAGCTFAVGLWGRFSRLGFPPGKIWDEIYFPVMARKYLEGVQFFDLHPPLGKFILALSIAVFGDTPLGWRLMPAIFGCALPFLGALLGWYYFREKVGALLLGAFVAGDTMLVIYSRTGIMDVFLLCAIVGTVIVALQTRRRDQVLWPAVLVGVSISIKWAALMVAVPAGYILWRRGLLRPFIGYLYVSFVIYIGVVYAGQLVMENWNLWQAWRGVWGWHLQAFRNMTNAVPNSEGSPWWSWPLMTRPILFRTLADAQGNLLVLMAIGNPVVWWSSTLAVVAGALELARRRLIAKEAILDHPLVPVLLGYVALVLPWIPSTRIPYLYNYLPSYVFALMALVFWLCLIWRKRPWGGWAVIAFTICALAATLYFLPLATGMPVNHENLQDRIWLESWQHPELQ